MNQPALPAPLPIVPDDRWQYIALDNQTDMDRLRRAFSHFPSGVVAVAADVDDQHEVLVASSFQVGISGNPPMALFAVQLTSTTWPRLRKAQDLGVSVLSEHQDVLCRQLAAKGPGRFGAVQFEKGHTGAIYLADSALQMKCRIAKTLEVGDHELIVVEVLATRLRGEERPMVFHQSKFKGLSDAS